ncbi:MAG: HEAT repeat domain-containing protein [Candidatus Heimdallarchaeaceae archaeon]
MSLLTLFHRWRILRKQRSENPLDRLRIALFLNKNGTEKDVELLYELIENKDWNVRNAAAAALIAMVQKYPTLKSSVLDFLHKLLETKSLATKLTTMEILGKLKDYTSKPFLKQILEESDYDLQYAAIRAIGYLDDIDLLESLKSVVYAKDYITRKAALLTVVRLVESVPENERIEKLTPYLHLLIEVYIELNQLGDEICNILDYGEPEQLPEMKGYCEYEIVKLESLINSRSYSPEMYRNFAKVIYPLYFVVGNQ